MIGKVRPVLTVVQLREIEEMLQDIRSASELRYEDVAEKLMAGELLGLDARSGSNDRSR